MDSEALGILQAHDPLSDSASSSIVGLSIDPDAEVLARLIIAASIATQEGNTERAERMRRSVAVLLASVTDLVGVGEFSPSICLVGLVEDWDESQRLLLLVECAASNPFAPHEIAWDSDHEHAALAHVAELIGLSAQRAADVVATFADAASAHRRISATRVGLYGLGAAAALGGAGFLAAPMIGGALGGAAGLSGAAATSHGLGLLGAVGGASAPGTMTAGGMWLVGQVGAATGALAGAGGSLLYSMGASQAQNEIIKLQATYKLILVDLQRKRCHRPRGSPEPA